MVSVRAEVNRGAPHGSDPRFEDGWHAGVRDVQLPAALGHHRHHTARARRLQRHAGRHLQQPASPAPERPAQEAAPAAALDVKGVLAAAQHCTWALTAPDNFPRGVRRDPGRDAQHRGRGQAGRVRGAPGGVRRTAPWARTNTWLCRVRDDPAHGSGRPVPGRPLPQRVAVPQREALMMSLPTELLPFSWGMPEGCWASAPPSVCHAIRVLQVLFNFPH